jgi:hypothetical protein
MPVMEDQSRHDIAWMHLELEGIEVRQVSYRLGQRYSCTIENDDGAVIGRGSGLSRDAAERNARSQAQMKLCLSAAGSALRRSVEELQRPRTSSARPPGRPRE